MSEEEISQKAMRPNDMCTASYYDDVAKLKELLTVPEVEEEPPLPEDFDPSDPEQQDPDHPAEVDEEAEAEKRERAEQRAKNKEKIANLLSHADVLTTRLSPVNIKKYGLHLYPTVVADPQSGGSGNNSAGTTRVVSRFRTSAKSTIAATPLHWAVLGRAHKAIKHLISLGADVDAACPILGVTPYDIAKANASFETLRIMDEAKVQQLLGLKAKEDAEAERLKKIEDRANALKEHRDKEAEEERLAAEREAAEEAGDYGHDGEGEYNEGGEYGNGEEEMEEEEYQ